MKERTQAQEEALLTLAKARFKQAEDADTNQRQRELDDLKFYAGDQWTDDQKDARKGKDAVNGMPPMPARPCYVINKVRQPVQQVTNDIRDADFSVEIAAADDFGDLVGNQDETEIELREGLARRIQRSPEASDARLWAAIRAVIAGRGYYSVMTRYAPGKTFDKEIYVNRYYNQASVSIDPAHEQPDGSDAEWGFEGNDLPWDRYEAEFPEVAGKVNQVIQRVKLGKDDAFRALGDDAPGWFTTTGKTRSCRVVNYWYTERDARTLCLMADASVQWKDELPKDLSEGSIVDERDVIQKKVKWAKIDGAQILEETDWEGPDIPIVKVLGEELQPYDNERRAEGIVRPARDSNMGFNGMVSKGVETIGLAPIPPWQATPEQIEGFESWYQAAPTRTLPYLPYNQINVNGEALDKPTRTPMGSDIQAIFAAMQMFDEAVQSTTGVPDSRVGRNTDSHLKSGKAIMALEQQSKQGTSNYRDNVRRSVAYEGRIINGLLYPIYGKKSGRLVRIMTGENETQVVRIGPAPQPTGAPANGNGAQPQPQPPAPMQPGSVLGLSGAGGPPAPKLIKEYKLTPDANFNVIVKVVRGSDSRRTEETSIIGDLLNANPAFMGWFGDLFFKNQDGPGHAEMAERAKVMLAPPIQAMLQAKSQGGEAPPPEVQQLQERIKQAEQAMQQLAQENESKKLENDTKIKIAEMDNATKMQIAAADRETKITVAELGAKVDRIALFLEERARIGVQAHESALSAQEHAQGLEAQQMGQQHAAGMAAAGGAQSAEEADAARAHEAEMAAQQAAAQPPAGQAGV